MAPYRSVWLLLVCILGVCLACWADHAGAHRRFHGPLWTNVGQEANTQANHDLKPKETALNQPTRLVSPAVQESCGFPSADQVKSINNCPNEVERAVALMHLADQAETHGHIDLARKVYTLAASLYPNTPGTDRARCKRLIIEFYLDLGGPDPYLAFRNFLEKLSGISTRLPSEELREPLSAGWLAVEQTFNGRSRVPVSLVEKALTLWEMHPPGTRPPEAALLLGRLLKDQGLFNEAGHLLSLAMDKGAGQVRTRALVELLELAWVSEGLPGFLNTLKRWQDTTPELILALRTWPLHLCSQDGGGASNLPVDALGDLKARSKGDSSPSALQDMLGTADAPLWDALLSQPLPASLKGHFVRSIAQRCWSQGDFARAGKLYRDILALPDDKETSLFYWDRLGLSHLRERQPDLAQDIFQALEKEQGQFWQLVARTRQLDLELSRLMAEPAL